MNFIRQKMLAFVCKYCPFCIVARKYPTSKFAKFVKAKEKNCPFCRAYEVIHGKHID